jgi:hypothetical protein
VNVALRETWRGRVWRVSAHRLVEERDGLLVLWNPQGSTVLRPFDEHGGELRVPGEADWRLERRASTYAEVGLVRPGSRWSIWLLWRDGAFRHWYVNFERGHRRGDTVVDFVDEKLDLVVDADGSWRWKDEDELELADASGYLDATDVRAEAQRVLAAPPWPTGWEGFRADPAWADPTLPEGWDVV